MIFITITLEHLCGYPFPSSSTNDKSSFYYFEKVQNLISKCIGT